MTTSTKHPETMDRRTFVRTSAAAGGALVLGSTTLTGCEFAPVPGGGTDTPNFLPTPPTGLNDGAWAAVREHFMLEPGVAYMNNASLGMPPRPVVDAVARGYAAISSEPLHGKHDLQDHVAQVVMPALATTFGAEGSELSLTRNATEALHLQTIGLRLERGDEVIITTQEHPAGHRPWIFRAAQHGIRVRELFLPSPLGPPEETVRAFAEAIGPRTKAIAFCHVTRGGHRYPVAQLCGLARDRGLSSLVDGAQAVGQFPIDLHALGCDAYSASLHKWILGPAGTGFLYIRSGAKDLFASAFEPPVSPVAPSAYAPPGTADFPVRAALSTALGFVNALGLDLVESRCRYLSDHLKSGLETLPGCTILSGSFEASAPGSTIFQLDGLDALAAVPLLEELAGTHIDEHQRDGHDAIRVSTHIYNTTAEIDRLVEGLVQARG